MIPLIPKHIEQISDVLSDLANQSIQNDEVILVASGFSRGEYLHLSREAGRRKNLNVVLLRAPLGPAGRNRNLGAEVAHGDLIMFLDADDRYLPWRNERVLGAFFQNNLDALVHLADHSSEPGATLLSRIAKGPGLVGPPIVVERNEIARRTFPGGHRNRINEVLGNVPTNIKLEDKEDDSPIQHAHVTVKRSVLSLHRFHESFSPRNEDGVFLRDLLFEGRNVGVLLEYLSVFSTGTSAVHWRAKVSWLLKSLRFRVDHQ